MARRELIRARLEEWGPGAVEVYVKWELVKAGSSVEEAEERAKGATLEDWTRLYDTRLAKAAARPRTENRDVAFKLLSEHLCKLGYSKTERRDMAKLCGADRTLNRVKFAAQSHHRFERLKELIECRFPLS